MATTRLYLVILTPDVPCDHNCHEQFVVTPLTLVWMGFFFIMSTT